MSTYAKKLRDPRWQKKRLRILERDEWTCQACSDSETTLNVHHKRYRKGVSPWDYEDAELVTLCEVCHKEEERAWREASTAISQAFRKHFLMDDIKAVAEALERLDGIPHESGVVAQAVVRWLEHSGLPDAVSSYMASLVE